MIIRMTIQDDNDYQKELKNFANDLLIKLLLASSDRETHNKIFTVFNSNETEEVTIADKFFTLKEINCLWSKYIDCLNYDEQTEHYLISNFFIEIIDSFQEKWENGQYVYYFSNSGAVIAQ